MRKSVLIFAFTFSLCCAVATVRAQSNDMTAQQNGGPPGGGQRGRPPTPAQELQRLTQALMLTDAQKTAILPILEKRQSEMQQLMSGSSDPSANRDQMHTILESTDAEIRAQLTEAQQQIFDKMKSRGGPGSGGPPGGASGNEGPPPQGV